MRGSEMDEVRADFQIRLGTFGRGRSQRFEKWYFARPHIKMGASMSVKRLNFLGEKA